MQYDNASDDYDVIVIGGGPSGSYTAGSLARQGVRVLVLEGKLFPRDHIGESLLSMSMPLLQEIGMEPKLHTGYFVRKPGALFIWGDTGQEIDLAMPHPGYSYHVVRSRFDELLLEHAHEQGAHILQQHWVRQLNYDPSGRICGVHVEGKNSQQREFRCRFLVDASGLAQFLPRRLNLPIRLEGPRRIAIGGYFHKALRPYRMEDHIISEACQDGWLWFIPLSKEIVSVGFVSDEETLDKRPGALLAEQITTTTLISRLMATAEATIDPRVLRYTNHVVDAPLWGDGYMVIGDSAMFVDPLFSTGVHGALYSGSLAAACLTSILTDHVPEVEAMHWYNQRVKDHYWRVNESIRLLYGVHPGTSQFWRRRDLTHMTEEEAEQMAKRLGAVGMLFFISAMRAGTLQLPSTLARRVPEFFSQVVVATISQKQVVCLAPEVRLSIGWMCSHGRLVRAVSLVHMRGRANQVEFPLGSFQAELLQVLGSQCTLAAAIAIALERCNSASAMEESTRAATFIGTLIKSGLLSVVEAIDADAPMKDGLSTVAGG